MKTALITGSAGQDGTYLSQYLVNLGYKVVGVSRASSSIDLRDTPSVFGFLEKTKPDEIYHLASFHHSSQDKLTGDLELLRKSNEIHVLAAGNLLEGMKQYCPQARLFYAATSHTYGKPTMPQQDESTPMNPDGIYGITKHAGMKLCHYYRNQYNIFASVGILYNHESPLRSSGFVSKKIVEAAVAIRQHRQDKLIIGDLNVEIDWGAVSDYVMAMYQILQLPKPDDFVISSGEKHSVREFVEEAFRCVGLDWQQYVIVDSTLLRSKGRPSLFGDNTKLRKMTGWKPTTSFPELMKTMIAAENQKRSQV